MSLSLSQQDDLANVIFEILEHLLFENIAYNEGKFANIWSDRSWSMECKIFKNIHWFYVIQIYRSRFVEKYGKRRKLPILEFIFRASCTSRPSCRQLYPCTAPICIRADLHNLCECRFARSSESQNDLYAEIYHMIIYYILCTICCQWKISVCVR